MTSDSTHDEGDDHYCVVGFSVEDDPYVYPNGVLTDLRGRVVCFRPILLKKSLIQNCLMINR